MVLGTQATLPTFKLKTGKEGYGSYMCASLSTIPRCDRKNGGTVGILKYSTR